VAETKYTVPQAAQKLAAVLKEKLKAVETEIQTLRTRELQPKEGVLAKHELCPLCGGADRNGVCNCLRKNATAGYGPGGEDLGAGGTGMGMSERGLKKTMESATKLLFEDKEPKKKDVLPKGPSPAANAKVGDDKKAGGKLTKHQMPSSSAAALAPATAKPATPVPQANHEMGGFQSLAHSPTAMPGTGRKPIAHMGRPAKPAGSGFSMTAGGASTPRASVSGTIPVAKAEKQMKQVKAVPEKPSKGAKLPAAGKSVDAKKGGTGGEIKELRKDASPMEKKVPGLQPVGQGGGDAHKVAATAGYPKAKLPLAGVGAKGVPSGPPGSVDVDVSEFDKGPAKPTEKFGALTTAGRGEVKRMIAEKGPAGNPNAKPSVAAPMKEMVHPNVEQARLNADKRAGGVGFLNALIRKFSPLAPAQGQQGLTSNARFHGATPLRRSEYEKPMSKGELALSKMGKCAGCKKVEHAGMCKGLGYNHSRNMLSVAPKKRGR
jgi:hypothetical protein